MTDAASTGALSQPLSDLNSLDDTRAGRLVQAGVVAFCVALPDYVPSWVQRLLINSVVLTGAVAAVAYLNMQDEDPSNDPEVIMERIRQNLEAAEREHQAADAHDGTVVPEGSPLRTWAIIVGLILGSVVLSVVEFRLRSRFTRFLARKGVKRPNTLLGLLGGAVLFGLSEVSAQ